MRYDPVSLIAFKREREICEVELPLPSDPSHNRQAKEKRDKRARVFTFVGAGAGFAPWGYLVVNPTPSFPFGAVLLLLAIICVVIAFCEHFEGRKRFRIPASIILAAILGIASMKWLVYETRPSFSFLVPGAVFNGDAWDFIVNHRGPKSSESVQILFIDDDRRSALLAQRPRIVTSQDIDSYQRILEYPEVNPDGRGQVFALQFVWKPLVMDHEHYTMEITDNEHRDIHQELQIEKVDGKWYWATQIIDSENKDKLLVCKDAGFPYGEKSPLACFPKFTDPGY